MYIWNACIGLLQSPERGGTYTTGEHSVLHRVNKGEMRPCSFRSLLPGFGLQSWIGMEVLILRDLYPQVLAWCLHYMPQSGVYLKLQMHSTFSFLNWRSIVFP